MSAIEPAGEKIARNLQQAIAQLHNDLERVEMWAGALGSFTQPIPDYGHGQTKFDLPHGKSRPAARRPGSSSHRKCAAKIASPDETSGPLAEG